MQISILVYHDNIMLVDSEKSIEHLENDFKLLNINGFQNISKIYCGSNFSSHFMALKLSKKIKQKVIIEHPLNSDDVEIKDTKQPLKKNLLFSFRELDRYEQQQNRISTFIKSLKQSKQNHVLVVVSAFVAKFFFAYALELSIEKLPVLHFKNKDRFDIEIFDIINMNKIHLTN